MLRILPALLLVLLTGCQVDPYTHAPARGATDWYQAGFEDATAGAQKKNDETLAANFNDKKVDRKAYLRGYASGQQKVCRPDLLYAWGLAGKIFPTGCDDVDTAPQLRQQWQKGMDEGVSASRLN
ncbi:MAG TPA: hypothetical protein DDY57_10915 [Franconibacter pulveris]|nr:hypothetical protein [Franconibacter pulveris]